MSGTDSSKTRTAERDAALAAFTRALAPRLPGEWTADVMDLPTAAARNALHERLWDLAHADWALGEFMYSTAGVLHGPADRELLVLPRPHPHVGQYIVAPLLPAAFGRTTDGVEHLAPHGITVQPDSVRAAAAVTGRLLPRYDQAISDALEDLDSTADSPFTSEEADTLVLRAAVRTALLASGLRLLAEPGDLIGALAGTGGFACDRLSLDHAMAPLGAVQGLDHVAGVRDFSHMIDPRRCRPAV
ncbi:hypothetical protein ACFVVU_30780 [Kitasatospora sp. NPDC057965]|uniref:hypothetical protein n=1 Tax=Kitasatospora sp. NPDC057965 TaxID=3346291 RepID=UPI0036DA29F1